MHQNDGGGSVKHHVRQAGLLAGALVGLPEQCGYAQAVERMLGVKLAKGHARTDWSRRPLREEFLEYAAEDVEYLLPAFERLSERLEEKGRLEWAREDSRWLLDPELYDLDNGQAIDRLKGARNFRGRRRAAAARLADWREAEAIRRNRPRQWIMRDNVLLDIAYRLPGSEAELKDIQGVPAKLIRRVGHQLLDAVASSAGDGGSYKPPRPPDEAQKALLKEMQAKVQSCADDLGIAAETVASKRELSAVIVAGNPLAKATKIRPSDSAIGRKGLISSLTRGPRSMLTAASTSSPRSAAATDSATEIPALS